MAFKILKERKEKDSDEEYSLEENEEEFKGRLDIMKFVADVKLRLKRDITADFILAKLEKKDKEAIIEMTSNAYFSKKLMFILATRSHFWEWNEKRMEYTKRRMTKEKTKYILKIGDAIFDSYMTRIYMTVLLNRNVDKNYMINVLAGYNSESDKEVEQMTEDISKKAGKLLENEEIKGGRKER
jgi:hypothetical protein